MNNYLLYGNKLIENDKTLKDFSKSLCNGVSTENLSKDNFKDQFMDLVTEILNDDISRTDINYENLMYEYRSELGDLLYEIENQGYDIPLIKFFDEGAKESFNYIVNKYIDIHFEELAGLFKYKDTIFQFESGMKFQDGIKDKISKFQNKICKEEEKIIKLTKDILKDGSNEFDNITLQFEEKLKSINIYSIFKKGTVYKVTDIRKRTENYFLYSSPYTQLSNTILVYPLNKNFKFYKGRRGYIQTLYLNEDMEIEKIDSNTLIRIECEDFIEISDGDIKNDIYKK